MKFHPIAAVSALALALAACSSPAEETAESQTAPEAIVQAAPTVAADGTALTPGKWNVGETGDGASAIYGEATGDPVLTLVCNRAMRQVVLTRAGAATSSAMLTLEVGPDKAGLAMNPVAEPLAGLAAAVDINLPIIRGMANEANKITLSGGADDALVLPGNRAIDRVLDSCS